MYGLQQSFETGKNYFFAAFFAVFFAAFFAVFFAAFFAAFFVAAMGDALVMSRRSRVGGGVSWRS